MSRYVIEFGRESAAALWDAGGYQHGPVSWLRQAIAGKKNNILIAQIPTEGNRVNLVCYPKKEHAGVFAASSVTLERMSPAKAYPGSLGSLSSTPLHGRELSIQIQGHFRIGNPGELSKDVAREYRDWRVCLLREFFSGIEKNGVQTVKLPIVTTPDGRTIGKDNITDFRKVAAEFGFGVQESFVNGATTAIARRAGTRNE